MTGPGWSRRVRYQAIPVPVPDKRRTLRRLIPRRRRAYRARTRR